MTIDTATHLLLLAVTLIGGTQFVIRWRQMGDTDRHRWRVGDKASRAIARATGGGVS